ncbi:MAG: glycoside hydrolase family 32 protein, partial [Lentisphaeria bacterium]|nr:glycoside hydrolase family 32 protein [Lentisphaeria bacterium]
MIPVRNQGDMISVIFSGSNMTIPLNLIPGTREDCDFIASYPLYFFGNTLRIDGENLDWLSEVTQSDLPATAPYDCPERQQFHYSATTGWLNDPNGLHWYNGEWHMFHQYNPLSNDWENMHWYHAVSSDLVHWKELGVTIPPLPCGTAFSGGAVIDWQNTSGLQEDPLYPPILLFYTAHIRKNNRPVHTQHLFYSTDGGKNYRKYSDEPIIGTFGDGGDRDPSVAWDPVHDEWLMALYLGDSNREFALLRSDDLIHWQEIQRFLMPDQGRECPELLWMRDDASGDYCWVILEANGNYLVWERQNGTMHPISEGKFLRLGKEYYGYACQSFTNAPDGVTGIGWQRSKIRHAAFSQSMTLPFQLRLCAGKLFVFPHPALETLRTGATEW